MSKYSTVTDQPAKDDLFEIGNYIDGLSKFIGACQTPMTIAIQGDWGTGKTSIMEQVEEKIDSADNNSKDLYCLVRFNAWQYSQFHQEDLLGINLIQSLVNDLNDKIQPSKKDEQINQAIKNISKSIKNISNNIFRSLNFSLQLPFSDTKLFELGFQPNIEKSNKNLKNLKEEFEKLIREITVDTPEKNENNRKKYKKVIFFIDDLDRLAPIRAVEVLEILKLFLDCEGCVFVLAIDNNIIEKGVEVKYGKIEEDKKTSFFEKIIQVPFRVPIQEYSMESYIVELFETNESSIDVGEIKKLITTSIGNNPRSIKRLANYYQLYKNIPKVSKVSNELLLLAALCMQLSYPQDYYELKNIKSTEDFIIDEDEDENNKNSNRIEFLKKYRELLDEDDVNDVTRIHKLTRISETSTSNETIDSRYNSFWKGFVQFLEKHKLADKLDFTERTIPNKQQFDGKFKKDSKIKWRFNIRPTRSNLGYYNEKLDDNKFVEIEDKVKETLKDYKVEYKTMYNIPGIYCTNFKINIESEQTATYKTMCDDFLKLKEIIEKHL